MQPETRKTYKRIKVQNDTPRSRRELIASMSAKGWTWVGIQYGQLVFESTVYIQPANTIKNSGLLS